MYFLYVFSAVLAALTSIAGIVYYVHKWMGVLGIIGLIVIANPVYWIVANVFPGLGLSGRRSNSKDLHSDNSFTLNESDVRDTRSLAFEETYSSSGE